MTHGEILQNRVTSSIEPLESRIAPAVFMVTSLKDDGSAGTLRSEILLAANKPGANTITFAHNLNGVVKLTTGSLSIVSNLTIDGPGANRIIIDGQDMDRVFEMSDVSVRLNGLAIVDGATNGNGGAIYSDGALSITNCVISGSVASEAGGGICDNGPGPFLLANSFVTGNSTSGSNINGGGVFADVAKGASVIGSKIIGNTATGSGGGLALYEHSVNTGKLTISGSVISGNASQVSGGGAALFDYSTAGGQIAISSSTFFGNTAPNEGGGIYLVNESARPASLKGLVVSGNSGLDGGGGLAATGTNAAVIQTSLFSGNTTSSYGGGISSAGNHSLTIQGSKITDNSADNGGGIGISFTAGSLTLVASVVAENHSYNSGGGLFTLSTSGVTTIIGSTIANNTSTAPHEGSAGGALIGGGGRILIQSTSVTGNLANNGDGGGLDFDSSSTSILLSGDRIAGNVVSNSSFRGGGIYMEATGPFTILGGSINGNESGGDGGGIFVSPLTGGLIKGVSIIGNASGGAGGGFADPLSVATVHITKPALITGNVAASITHPNTYGIFETP